MTARRRGPALIYIDSAGHHHDPARTPIPDPVERALCGALLDRATTLADKADEPDVPRRPIGFTATADTHRTGD